VLPDCSTKCLYCCSLYVVLFCTNVVLVIDDTNSIVWRQRRALCCCLPECHLTLRPKSTEQSSLESNLPDQSSFWLLALMPVCYLGLLQSHRLRATCNTFIHHNGRLSIGYTTTYRPAQNNIKHNIILFTIKTTSVLIEQCAVWCVFYSV